MSTAERSEYVLSLEEYSAKRARGDHNVGQSSLTEDFRSSSPFWRARTSESRQDSSPKNKSKDSGSGIVVGASYSHADMLKFDNLYVSPCSRSWLC